MTKDNVDQHIADADQHLVQDNRKALLQKFLQKCCVPFPVSGNIKKIRDMLDLRRHHDDKHIYNRRNDGSDGRSADSHGRKAKLSEDQDIVADAVRDNRSNCAGKRNFHTLHRAEQRRHGNCQNLKHIGKADEAQVLHADLLNRFRVRIELHDPHRLAQRKIRCSRRRHRNKGQHDSIGFPDPVMVSLAPELRNEQHSAADKAPVSGEHQAGKLRA